MHSIERIRHISPKDLAVLGLQDIAYIKRIVVADVVGYSVHAADGTEIATVPDRSVAFAMVRQHDMEPVSVH
jgi:hypothetical protein